MTFPKRIYVQYSTEGDSDGYYIASIMPAGEHNEQVAVYELHSVKKMKIIETLV